MIFKGEIDDVWLSVVRFRTGTSTISSYVLEYPDERSTEYRELKRAQCIYFDGVRASGALRRNNIADMVML